MPCLNIGHAHFTDHGISVGVERARPLRCMFDVAPFGRVRFDVVGSTLPEGGDSLCLAAQPGRFALLHRVDTLDGLLAGLSSFLAGLGQRHIVESTQPHFAALAVNGHPHNPRTRTGITHVQVQAGDTAYSVHARFLDPADNES